MRTAIRRVDVLAAEEWSTVVNVGGAEWPGSVTPDQSLPVTAEPAVIVEFEDADGRRVLVRYRAVDAMVL